MPERTIFPEWRAENVDTRYPFVDHATLTGDRLLLDGQLLDALFYVPGAGPGLYLANVTLDHETATLTVGTPGRPGLASGAFSLLDPPEAVAFADPYGRPAGLVVSEPLRLSIFQSWGVGSFDFKPAATEFCPAVVVPTPEVGLRGVRLPSGEVLTGEVWLVGDDGVVVRRETRVLPGACGGEVTREVLRVDVVGDPLFRRRLCSPPELFAAPNFVRFLRFVGPNREFTCGPDAAGGLRLTANDGLAADTVLRVVVTPEGLRFGVAGEAAG